MFILVVLAIALVLGVIRGGMIVNLADVNIRWRGLILLGFLIQILIFSDFWQARNEMSALTPLAYLASLGLLLVALAMNYQLPGMRLIASGFCLNFVVIALNGGYMPASTDALTAAGLPPLLPGQVSTNSIGIGPDTRLVFLSDIFAIPQWLIFANVFSIGDVLITVGAVYMIQQVMVAHRGS
jgi:hypothetical protein